MTINLAPERWQGEDKVDRIINSVSFNEDPEYIGIKLNTLWAVDRTRTCNPIYSPSTEKGSFVLGNETDDDLFQMTQDLIERTSEGVGPLEMKAIEILSKDMLKELKGRLNKSEETKTRRNKLIRYLRKEIEEFRK